MLSARRAVHPERRAVAIAHSTNRADVLHQRTGDRGFLGEDLWRPLDLREIVPKCAFWVLASSRRTRARFIVCAPIHPLVQNSVTWRVWAIERFTPLFPVRLAADKELLDARGHVVLLRREDELDVPRAVVTRLVAFPESRR